METDQKLGLLAGVAAVLVVAVVYFSKPQPAVAGGEPAAAVVDGVPTLPPASVAVPARPARRVVSDD